MFRLQTPRSAPGYFLTLFAVLIIAKQVPVLLNPKSSMQGLGIKDEESAKFIGNQRNPIVTFIQPDLRKDTDSRKAFALILINIYDLLGALQDNWAIYWFSLLSRLAATALFTTLGGGWKAMWPLEFGSAIILGLCMMLPA